MVVLVLAVVVRTAHNALVYVAVPIFLCGGEAGRLSVSQFLAVRGVLGLDAMIICHVDDVHRGGARSVACGTHIITARFELDISTHTYARDVLTFARAATTFN